MSRGPVITGTSTGIRVEARHKAHAVLPEFTGRHVWAYVGVWRVAEPARDQVQLDVENLLTIEGPGCWWCEQRWRPDIGAHCPGEPEPPTTEGNTL